MSPRPIDSAISGVLLRIRPSGTTDNFLRQRVASLIKRGRELHEPDRMYLKPNQIVFAESVGLNSKVGQLITEQKKP